jgi:hypothetical protein
MWNVKAIFEKQIKEFSNYKVEDADSPVRLEFVLRWLLSEYN